MKKKPDWMSIEDWQQIRVETMKDNIIAGGRTIAAQEENVEYYKVKCSGCEQTFFEFKALEYCPHCAVAIDPQNIGEVIRIKLVVDTKMGEVKIVK